MMIGWKAREIPASPAMDGVTYDSLPILLSEAHVALCTNTYSPPGNDIPVTYPLPLETDLTANVADGGEVSFLFYAADNQIDYLFNSSTTTAVRQSAIDQCHRRTSL